MEDVTKEVKSFEDYGLILKGFRETIQSEAKEQKGGFLSMLLGTLGASLVWNILAGKGINRAGQEIIRAGYGSWIENKDFWYHLILSNTKVLPKWT